MLACDACGTIEDVKSVRLTYRGRGRPLSVNAALCVKHEAEAAKTITSVVDAMLVQRPKPDKAARMKRG